MTDCKMFIKCLSCLKPKKIWHWTFMHTSIIWVPMRYYWTYLMWKIICFKYGGSKIITFILTNVSCYLITWAKISSVNSFIWLFWHKDHSNKAQKENQATRTTQINAVGGIFHHFEACLSCSFGAQHVILKYEI